LIIVRFTEGNQNIQEWALGIHYLAYSSKFIKKNSSRYKDST